MEKSQKLALLAEIMDADADSLTEDAELREVGEWDSLSILSFAVLMEDEFGKETSRESIRKLVTVGDALRMMEGQS